ncbi:MAG: hypothetical protein IJQ80_04970 [Clostridia bacterium]|nr:hypothetical protein [Clostridia bacterium]
MKKMKKTHIILICLCLAAIVACTALLSGCGCSSKGNSGSTDSAKDSVSSDNASVIDADDTKEDGADSATDDTKEGSGETDDADGTDAADTADPSSPAGDNTTDSDNTTDDGNTSDGKNTSDGGEADPEKSYLTPTSPNADPVETFAPPSGLGDAETVDEHALTDPDDSSGNGGTDTSDASGKDAETGTPDLSFEYLNSKAYKALKKKIYTNANGSYNWYEFYNGCILGTVDITEDNAVKYTKDCLALFLDNDLPEEAARAKALLDSVRGITNVSIDD